MVWGEKNMKTVYDLIMSNLVNDSTEICIMQDLASGSTCFSKGNWFNDNILAYIDSFIIDFHISDSGCLMVEVEPL